MAPLGARAADLVVWWEKGFYDQEDEAVREIIAAFEQETGKQVELVLLPHGRDVQMSSEERSGRAAARLPVRLAAYTGIPRWAYEDRLVDLEGALGPVLRPVRCRRHRSLAPCSMAARASARSTPCQWVEIPTTSMSGTACWSGPASPSLTFQGVGGVLGLLVRPGAAGRAPGHGPRRHLGRRPAHVGRGARTR